jgi:hypothetical protein
MTRTPEQELALSSIKDALRPHVGTPLDEFAELLADVPEFDLDPAIYGGVGRLLVETLQQTQPQLSDSMKWAMSFAFCELLSERIRQ